MSEWKIAPSQVYDNGTIRTLEANDTAMINFKMFCAQHGIRIITDNKVLEGDIFYLSSFQICVVGDYVDEANLQQFIGLWVERS